MSVEMMEVMDREVRQGTSEQLTYSQLVRGSPGPLPHPRSSELFIPGAVWAGNDTVDKCGNDRCQKTFRLLARRRHCRWCGGIYCDACAPKTVLRNGAWRRRCTGCSLPVIFRSFVNERTQQRECGPFEAISAFLTPRSVTALMQTCRTMLREFPVPGVPYYPSIKARFPSFYEGAQIGRGSFGIVYKCEDRLSRDTAHRYVAIKRLIKTRNLTQSMWAKVLSEARLLERVNHPNVARVLEVFQTEADLLIVMEAGDGGTVRQACEYLRRQHLPVTPLAAVVLQQVAAGLGYLYRELGVVHRDIKLDNIVVSGDYSRALLIDFGLAEVVPAAGEREFLAAGTPGFASPENIYAVGIQRRPVLLATAEVMHRADIFSLGVVLFIMLSRRRPIRSKNFDEQYREVQRGIVCAGPGWEEVPMAAAAIVARTLSLEAAQRPSCAELAACPFAKEQAPLIEAIAEFRQAARRRDDEEQRQDWVVVDTPGLVGEGTRTADFQQFPRPLPTMVRNVYGSLVRQCWLPEGLW